MNPHAYLIDVLERLVAGHLNSHIDELMPWRYAAIHDVCAQHRLQRIDVSEAMIHVAMGSLLLRRISH